MQVDGRLLKQLEALSKLKLDSGQQERFRDDLNEIIGYISVLSSVTDDGEDGLCGKTETAGLRDDVPEPSEISDRLPEAAPETREGCFAVPDTLGEVRHE